MIIVTNPFFGVLDASFQIESAFRYLVVAVGVLLEISIIEDNANFFYSDRKVSSSCSCLANNRWFQFTLF